MSPNEIVIQFIKRQPVQIRDSICAGFFLLIPQDELEQPNSSEEFAKQAYQAIDPEGIYTKAVAAASAIGVIDYHFWRPLSDPSNMKKFCRDRKS